MRHSPPRPKWHLQWPELASKIGAGLLVDWDAIFSYITRWHVNQPRCFAYRSTTQSIPDNAETAILFDLEKYDIENLHSITATTSRFTIPSGAEGVYLCIGRAAWAANAAGVRDLFINVNGVRQAAARQLPGAATAFTMECTTFIRLEVADYVEFSVLQNSGGALNLNGVEIYATSGVVAKVV